MGDLDTHGMRRARFARITRPAHEGWLLVAILAIALAAAGCSRMGPAASGAQNLAGPASATAAPPVFVNVEGGGSYATVEPAQLAGMLEEKDFTLVNVHVPYEGELRSTDVFIPYDQIAGSLERLPIGRDAKIVVYCRSGRMSTIAAETLVKLGFTNVWELNGGFNAWQKAGYALVQDPPG